MNSTKKFGLNAIVLSVLSLLFPFFAPFALWQGIKAKKQNSSKLDYIGFLLSNVSMAIFVARVAGFIMGYFSIY